MFNVGIVLSAGGSLGDPWHSGVLARVMETTGFDARTADLIVGTSAGSITGVGLRSGTSPLDRAAHHRGTSLSEHGAEIFGRVTTPWTETEDGPNFLPSSPKMSLRAVWPPWKVDPLRVAFGAFPRGRRRADSLATRVSETHPGRWPEQPTWVVAVRTDDGTRVVFGRDDVDAPIGDAVQASCAIPGIYAPKKIGRSEFVDGGLHSSTNADLVALLGFDLVIVSSVMTSTESARDWIGDPTRAWFSRKLDSEVETVRNSGTPVLVVQPGPDEVGRLSKDIPDSRAEAVDAGAEAVDRAFSSGGGTGIRELLEH